MHKSPMVIIFATILISLILGMLARRKKKMDLEQWSVGGRGFGVMFVFLLLAGEIYTTFTFLGGSGWAYGTGGPTVYILAYGAVAYLFSYFLLPPIWRYAKEHNLISQPDFFIKMFDSKWLGILVAVVGVVAIIPYLQSQMTGLGLIVETASYGTISQPISIGIAMIVLAVYVTISGIHGTAWTAVLKDILIVIVVLFIGIALPIHVGGFHDMFTKINQEKPGFLTLGNGGMGIPWFISTVAMTGLGFYMWPHAFGAVYTAKHERIFRRNAIFLPLYQLVLLFVFFAGFAAILVVPNLQNSNLALLAAVQKVFPAWVAGIIGGAGVLTAIVPGSLMLMSAGTLIAENIYRPLSKGATDAKVQIVARVFVWIVAAVTFLFSLQSNAAIVSLLLMGYDFVSQFFPTVLLAIFARGAVSKVGAFAGILVGVGLVVYFTLSGQSILWGVNIGFWSMLGNMIVVLIVSALTRDASSKVRETVTA
ncbi:sodium:solute symporter [Alicyclobacillus acidoterrestris]|uniref:sodium:solute symporter family protein n=1 Tax=Alicyclobacillus suci TaxID=2816080 RepID=UPI001195DEE4|nr:sodium:solute symporter family protein [Alicyclobacillus suci]GEO24649.1 sodium:solute symporter [Alicyclobacillus acidoterrestris]